MKIGIVKLLGAGMLSMVVVGGVGCSPPKGENNGRVEVTDTTPAERQSAQVQLTAQHEFSDKIAQQLAADLHQVPALNGEYRATVVFGDIVNKTGIVPTSDFEAFRTRIRGKLMQSQNVLKNVRFVENKARVDDLIRREGGGKGDVLQEGQGSGQRAALNPKYTYFLNGEMYRSNRTGGKQEVNEYLMSYNLTSMDTGEIIWQNEPYEVKQVR
jgi:PBP1b-binding outer membrane lipoprotein LpoB